jgi:hypothetical protein
MGYESNVYIKAPKEKIFEVKQLKDGLKALKFNENEDYTCTYDANYTYIAFKNWKFYDRYPEVAMIYSWIHDNAEDVGFVRIGEDIEDIEVIGNTYDVDLYPMVVVEGFNDLTVTGL